MKNHRGERRKLSLSHLLGPGGVPSRSPRGPGSSRRLHTNRAPSSPSARPALLPPTAPGPQPLPQRPALPSTRRLPPPPPQPTPSLPRRQPRPSFRPRRPPAARPRYREYGGGRGESRLGPKRANRSPPQVPPPLTGGVTRTATSAIRWDAPSGSGSTATGEVLRSAARNSRKWPGCQLTVL